MSSEVTQAIQTFVKACKNNQYKALHNCYNVTFPQICEKYYQSSPMPDKDYVIDLVGADYDPVGVALYKEIMLSHALSKVRGHVTNELRQESFQNYEQIFDFLLRDDGEDSEDLGLPVGDCTIQLTPQWIWNIFSEFVFQYQDTQRLRFTNPVVRKIEQWDSVTVKGWLMEFVEASGITKENKNKPIKGQKMILGYYALIALVKLLTLCGDFSEALEYASHLTISSTAPYWSVPSANIALFYHLSVVYLFLGRYIDCTNVLAPLLVFFGKSYWSFNQTSTQGEHKLVEKMFYIYKLCWVLSPIQMPFDESIRSEMRDYDEKWSKNLMDDENKRRNQSMFKEMVPSKYKSLDNSTLTNIIYRALPKFCRALSATTFQIDSPVLSDILGDGPDGLTHNVSNTLLSRRRLLNAYDLLKASAKLFSVLTLEKLENESNPDGCATIINVHALCVQSVSMYPDNRLGSSKMVNVVGPGKLDLQVNHDHSVKVGSEEFEVDVFDQSLKEIADANAMLKRIKSINNTMRKQGFSKRVDVEVSTEFSRIR